MLTVGALAAAVVTAGCGSDDDGGDAARPAAASTQAQAATTPAPAPSATTEAQTPAAEPAGTSVSSTPIARAVAVAAQQKGLAVAMQGTIKAKGVDTKLSGDGRIDRRTHRGEFTVTTGIQGQKIAVRTITDGHAVYLSSDLFKGRLPGKKSWMKIDLAKAAKQRGFDLSGLGSNGPSQDPSQVLDYLRGASNVKKIGTETIRGAKTTHYRVTADLKRAKTRSTSKASKLAIQQLLDTLVDKTSVPVDVWIDGQDRVVRERVAYTAKLQGSENAMQFTTDFKAFDVPVKADAPSDKDTVDGLALLQKAQAAQQEQEQAG